MDDNNKKIKQGTEQLKQELEVANAFLTLNNTVVIKNKTSREN